MSNPKERFLKLVAATMEDFEKETGVEVHLISIKRVNVTETGDCCDKTTPVRFRLELR